MIVWEFNHNYCQLVVYEFYDNVNLIMMYNQYYIMLIVTMEATL